jgi:hypothetical protein
MIVRLVFSKVLVASSQTSERWDAQVVVRMGIAKKSLLQS